LVLSEGRGPGDELRILGGGAGNGLDLRVALRAAHEANMTELCASASSVLELLFVQSASRNPEKGKSEEMAGDSRENDSR
jgi:hypothetical protein